MNYTCTNCHTSKPETDFYKDNRSKLSGRASWCKQCISDATHKKENIRKLKLIQAIKKAIVGMWQSK